MSAIETHMIVDRGSTDHGTADEYRTGMDALHHRAHAAYDAGDLAEARACFDALLAATPDNADAHYMQGLVCKYLRDWPTSLGHNLQSLALRGEADEASQWNAAIAATALGDWAEARRQWKQCDIAIPDGDGAIDGQYGVASIRLDAWGSGETLFGCRIDPVRARLINVPLPDNGYRYGDIVLHDGAATGQRRFHQSMVPVLNALQRLQTSEFQTFAVFAVCPRSEDLDALVDARVPGIAFIEDWTESVSHLCLRCSYSVPHRRGSDAHATHKPAGWVAERTVGVAAQSRHSVAKLLQHWRSHDRQRRVDAIESRDVVPSTPPTQGERWWLSPEDREA